MSDNRFALLSMDFQRAMCEPDGRIGAGGLAAEIARRDTVSHVAEALGTFRSNAWQVIHVHVAFDDNYSRMTSASPRLGVFREHAMMLDSAEETQIVPALKPLADEPVIAKGCVNPFVGTYLREFLTLRGIRHLILAGVATNHVVESTARYAADIGYEVTVVEDLCASQSQELHEFSIEQILPNYANVRSAADLMSTLS
jgi:biuret amidohydrolase